MQQRLVEQRPVLQEGEVAGVREDQQASAGRRQETTARRAYHPPFRPGWRDLAEGPICGSAGLLAITYS
jgi:hypothetical protein